MDIELFIQTHGIKGFLAGDEGRQLSQLVKELSYLGPCLELGSYCGLSTLYLGLACKGQDNTLYSVDHHRGSEEHQLGEQYHDAALYDEKNALMDSFPMFRRTLRLSGLEETVVPLVCSSSVASRHWATPLSLVFIDGGHSEAMALSDCLAWSKNIVSGGVLAVHDIFENPEDGGQGPYQALHAVLAQGDFILLPQVNSLGLLQKK